MPLQSHELFRTDDESVQARLVCAADEEMRRQSTAAVTMAAVAERAGVSRATAFRHFGSASRMIIQVGIHRARTHTFAHWKFMTCTPTSS